MAATPASAEPSDRIRIVGPAEPIAVGRSRIPGMPEQGRADRERVDRLAADLRHAVRATFDRGPLVAVVGDGRQRSHEIVEPVADQWLHRVEDIRDEHVVGGRADVHRALMLIDEFHDRALAGEGELVATGRRIAKRPAACASVSSAIIEG